MHCPSCGAFITQEASHCPKCKQLVSKVTENDKQSSQPVGSRTSIPGQRRRKLQLQKASQENMEPNTLLDHAPTLPIENLAEHLSSSASAEQLDETPTLPIEGLHDHASTTSIESPMEHLSSSSAPTAQLDETPTLPIEGLPNVPTNLLPEAQNSIPTNLLPEVQNNIHIEYLVDVQHDTSTEDLSDIRHYTPTEDLSDVHLSSTAEDRSSRTDTSGDYSSDASDMPTRPVTALPAPPSATRVRLSGGRLVTRAAIAAPRPSRRSPMTIMLLCLVVLLVGGGAAGAAILKGTTVTLPPSVLDGSPTPIEGPSGQVIDLTAGAIISNVNLASKIDNNYLPVIATTTFMPKQRVYLTFVVNSQNQPGYIMVKWYANEHLLAEDQMAHNPQDNVAFFSYVYNQPTPATAELYWCASALCSDAKLAHVVSFTVQEGD